MIDFKFSGENATFDVKNLNICIGDEQVSLNEPKYTRKKEVYFKLNNYCNLNCKYCYQQKEPSSKKDDSKLFSGYDSIIKKIFEEGDIFHLFGGEPFLDYNFEKIEKLLYFASYKKKINVFTNGFFSEKYIDLLQENRKKIGVITITLDGKEDVHNARRISLNGEGSFGRIVNNIERLVRNNIPVVIQINIDKDNYGDVCGLIEYIQANELLCSCGILMNRVLHTDKSISEMEFLRLYVECSNRFQLKLMINSVIVRTLTEIILEEYSIVHGRCNAGNTYVFDFSDGNIYSCPESSDTKCGQFNETKIDVQQNIVNSILEYTQKNNNVCNSCDYKLFCGKGCYIEQDLHKQGCQKEVEKILKFIFDNFESFFEIDE